MGHHDAGLPLGRIGGNKCTGPVSGQSQANLPQQPRLVFFFTLGEVGDPPNLRILCCLWVTSFPNKVFICTQLCVVGRTKGRLYL